MRTFFYLLMALVFGGLALWMLNGQLDKMANTLPAQGVIVDTQSSRSGKVTTPVVRFTADSGQVIEKEVFRKKRTSMWDKGDTLPLLYKQSDPHQVMVNEFSSLWSMELLCGFLALGFGLLFIRRILPESSSGNQRLKDMKVLCLVPAFFAFVLALQMIIVA